MVRSHQRHATLLEKVDTFVGLEGVMVVMCNEEALLEDVSCILNFSMRDR